MNPRDRLAPVREVVRKHRPNPILDVQIEYDAGLDRDERGPYSWFHVMALNVCGRDVSDRLEKALGPEAWAKLESVLEQAMQEQAQESRDEARIEAAR
jgi:hypothetical protein